MNSRVAVVIPARYASSRLPGKPLIALAGKPMIEWVYRQARQIHDATEIVVATDDARIVEAVHAFGGKALMTPVDCANGSERVGWVARSLTADIIVNLQGDEPLVSPEAVSMAIRALQQNPALGVATLGFPLRTALEWQNPSIVKVLVDVNCRALLFSRAPIPYPREATFSPLPMLFRHIGVYVYRKSFLMKFLSWPEGVLEGVEKLEQLRILERGHAIRVIEADALSPGVDTPDDIPAVEEFLKAKG